MNLKTEEQEQEDRRLMPPPPNPPAPSVPGPRREKLLKKKVRRLMHRYLLKKPWTSEDIFNKIQSKVPEVLTYQLEQFCISAAERLKPKHKMVGGQVYMFIERQICGVEK